MKQSSMCWPAQIYSSIKIYWPLLTTVLEMLKACYKMLPKDLFELEIYKWCTRMPKIRLGPLLQHC